MKLNRFQFWAVLTTLATYFLIMVGALVRAAGAGMGCPDWPRCFDRWIPPTDVSQVPAHIDPALFNVTLAWIEYINRLIGVMIGIFIFVTLVLALRHYRKVGRVLWPTVAAFVGVVFEGWLGSLVVRYHLDPHFVTLHLLVALGVVSLLLYATVCAFFPEGKPLANLPAEREQLGVASRGVLAYALLHVGVGAWLRGDLEVVAEQQPMLARGAWIDQVGFTDPLHRLMSFILLALIVWLFVWVRRKFRETPWLVRTASFCLGLVVVQLIVGLVLAELALPPAAQVLHLLLASLLMGGLTMLSLLAFRLPVGEGQPSPAVHTGS
ncbi:MAG: COX15/CtaA family protein [Myxococcota bacterium]